MELNSLYFFALISTLLSTIHAMRYDPAYVQWNLNTAVDALNPLDYAGVWENHTFNPSPDNWRFPFYTLMLEGILLRNIGDVITKCDLLSYVSEHPTVGKGNSGG